MFRKGFRLRAVAVIGVAALALTACGDDDDDEGGDDTGSDDTAANCTESDDGLSIGTILPQTGSLAFLGPPEFAGVDLAIQEINAGGGVLDSCVSVQHTDSGDTTTDISSQSASTLVNDGVHAVIGAASSGVSFQFIEQLYNEQVIQVSPANTSPDFTTYEYGDYYFRTAPSDVLQGRVLADQILADGNATLGILALQDAYGTGLAENIERYFVEGGGEVVFTEVYDPNAAEYSAEAALAANEAPDALALVTFNEFTALAPALQEAGAGPKDLAWYMVDGNLSNDYEFDPGFLEGVKGTFPQSEITEEFRNRLLDINPDLVDFIYGPESYDATMLVALAALAAGDVDSTAIRDQMVAISRDGTECTGFTECADLIAAGEDIDYNGVSGPIEWSDVGDVTAATIAINEYGPDNTYTAIDYRFGEIEG